MCPWKTTLWLGPTTARLLITDEDNHEILKARLPLRPTHPRAVLSMLEGLALWAGHPLGVALGVTGRSDPSFARWIFDQDGMPEDSALLRFTVVGTPRPRRRTLAGVGDFRQLRLLHRDGRWS